MYESLEVKKRDEGEQPRVRDLEVIQEENQGSQIASLWTLLAREPAYVNPCTIFEPF